jgi:predicted alpha/beta-fold hydrolase
MADRFVAGMVACMTALLAEAGIAQTTAATYAWQKMQMPTAAEVAKVWKAPPPEYGPNVYYTISGAVDREVLARDLDTAVRLGFHAVTVQPRRGNKEAYLSPEYFRMLWSEMQLHFSSFLGEVVKLEEWRRIRRHSLSSDVPQTRSTSK